MTRGRGQQGIAIRGVLAVLFSSVVPARTFPASPLLRAAHWAAPKALSSECALRMSEQIQQLTQRTLGHYSRRAAQFWEGTKDHDVSQNRDALLRHLPSDDGKSRVLDLGCGPGRDVKFFHDLGLDVTGLDGCKEFVDMCQQLCPGASVMQQDLHTLSLPSNHYHGIFANAVLFHVKRTEVKRVLGELTEAIKPGGVLFVSNPRSMQGQDVEKMGDESDNRYGHYQTLESWRAVCESVGLEEVEHYYRPPGQPLANQPWLASVWKKT